MNWKTLGKYVRTWLTAPFTPKIRIAVANQPRLLRDMLCQLIENEPDFRVVAVAGDPAKLWQALNRVWADWVVMSAPDPLPYETLPATRFRNQMLAFVTLSHDAQSAEVTIPIAPGRPRRQVFANLTPDQLFAILRRQAG